MKYTLNIDECLLERVIGLTGATTKTEAIHIALRELDRRARLLEELRRGSGVVDDEISGLFDPKPKAESALRVAEETTPYVTKGPAS